MAGIKKWIAFIILGAGLSFVLTMAVPEVQADADDSPDSDHNTPIGINVKVDLQSVELQFSTIMTAGATTISTSSDGPALPTGYQNSNAPSAYLNISTTAKFAGDIQMCVIFNQANISGTVYDQRLLQVSPDHSWHDITVSNYGYGDARQLLCGQAKDLSVLAIARQPRLSDLFIAVDQSSMPSGVKGSLEQKMSSVQQVLDSRDLGDRAFNTAENKLRAMVNELRNIGSGILDPTQADYLTSFANNIFGLLSSRQLIW